jgi:hypothetical protein
LAFKLDQIGRILDIAVADNAREADADGVGTVFCDEWADDLNDALDNALSRETKQSIIDEPVSGERLYGAGQFITLNEGGGDSFGNEDSDSASHGISY